MNKYIVIDAPSRDGLSAEVTKRLNIPGWFLVGGVAVVQVNKDDPVNSDYLKDDPVNGNYLYSQAMVYDEGQLKRHVQQMVRPK